VRNIVIILIIGLIAFGCIKEETKHADISFNVDETLLSSNITFPEVNLSFNPPSNWEEIDQEMLSIVQSKVIENQDSIVFNPLPIKIFMDMESSCTCFVSTFKSSLMAKDVIENYLNDFRLVNNEIELNEGSFSHNGIDFHQIVFNKEDFTSIKLIANTIDQKVFIIEYVVPTQYYEKELRSIESSIGTIKKIK
jgi:hypothetical protein